MKIHADNPTTRVIVDAAAKRPILVHLAGLTFAMYDVEARALADQLHDAADDVLNQRADPP